MRRRDGSGRGANFGPATGADIRTPVTTSVLAPTPVADLPANTPAVVSRSRTVAIVAKPESCIGCGTCAETCPRSAIAVEEIAVIDARLCTGCGMCVEGCSYGALALAEI